MDIIIDTNTYGGQGRDNRDTQGDRNPCRNNETCLGGWGTPGPTRDDWRREPHPAREDLHGMVQLFELYIFAAVCIGVDIMTMMLLLVVVVMMMLIMPLLRLLMIMTMKVAMAMVCYCVRGP